ncbi:hypothetical protein [Maribacter sp. 2-571]|uniref:hypothetical protein n=1 Tax=Maribacter sp. 2-571 TaxID=3417569 RepID=UPI003D3550E2
MIKILRYTEYVYLVVAVFAAYRVFTDWNIDRNNAYLFLFFAVVSIGMFFFRRSFRQKFERRNRENQQ